MKSSSKRLPRGHVVDALFQSVCEKFSFELKELAAIYAADYPDATPEERRQIDLLIRSHWMWKCGNRVEDHIWREEVAAAENPELALGEAWIKRSADFMRVGRRVDAASRDFHRACRELRQLRATRKAAPQPVARREPSSQRSRLPELVGPAARWVM